MFHYLGYTVEELRDKVGEGEPSTWRSWQIQFDDGLEMLGLLNGNLNVVEAVLLELDPKQFTEEDGIFDLQNALKTTGCK